jgi:hypothetical protein
MKSNYLGRTISAIRGLLLVSAIAIFVAVSATTAQATPPESSVPEISPTAIGSALTLLGGSFMLLRSRLSKQ